MEPDNEIGLAEAILSVRAELLRAQQEGAGSGMPFEVGEVELELEVELQRARGGSVGVNIYAFTAGVDGRHSSTGRHRVAVKLRPLDVTGQRTAQIGSVQSERPVGPSGS